MPSSSYDYPATGGGPSSGLTQNQVDARITTLVNSIALAGDSTEWPANKLAAQPIPNTDSVTEGQTNLYFTTERALAAAAIPLTLGAVTGGTQYQQLRTASETGGNAIDIPSGVEHGAADGGFLLELNGFYAQVLFQDLIGLPVAASNDTTADTSGNTQNAILFQQPDIGNGVAAVRVGRTAADKLLLAGSYNDGSSTTDATDEIKIYPLDHARHGAFQRDDPAETTIADDDYLVFFDTSEAFSPPKRITGANMKTYLGSGGGGGQTITAAVLEGLIDDDQGNVDASLTSDNSKVILTATVTGGGGGTFTLTQANLRPVLNDTLLVGSGLTKTVSTANNTITLDAAGGTPGGNPADHERVYFGHQAGTSFASWAFADADGSHDVRTAGQTFEIDISDVPNGDIYYMVFPNDRLPTRITAAFGANLVNDFTTVAVTISSQNFTAYYRTNNSGAVGQFALTVTTA